MLSLNSISVGFNFVLGILSTKVISVFLGPAGMALLGSFRNFGTMLKSLATVGINNSVIMLVVKNKNDETALSAIYSTFFWLFLTLSSILCGLLLLLANPISNFLFYTEAYATPVRFFGLILPLVAINAFWIALYNGWTKYKRIVLIQIVSNVFVFGITALLISKQHIYGGLLALGVGELLMFLVTFVYVRIDRLMFTLKLTQKIDRQYTHIIGKFSIMALVSAILVPLVLILVRNNIVAQLGIEQAGIWDAANRLSGFYMTLFSSGLSLYYMPKLASLHKESEFKAELKTYFKTFIPLFIAMLVVLFAAKDFILDLAFTQQFSAVKSLLFWQMAGDLVKMITLAFGFQILVKTMIVEYLIIEVVFNFSYWLLAVFLIPINHVEGALQGYAIANLLSLMTILWMFRKLFLNRTLE